MKVEAEQVLLRVWLRNTDRSGLRPAATALVEAARTDGLAGATVLRGCYGFDLQGELLSGSGWSLVEHCPVIVEVVDHGAAVAAFLPKVAHHAPQSLVTLERAHVLVYRADRSIAASQTIPESIAPLSTVPLVEDSPIMPATQDGKLVRVFIGESDEVDGVPLYQAIVLEARRRGLAGATVLKGVMGFGANSRLHTTGLLELSSDLPILIELVDSAEKIALLLPYLDDHVAEGLMTIEDVRILRYAARAREG